MTDPKPHPDLIKVTEIFLVPSSFLVAALGTADTNFHRAAISLLGLVISLLWWFCSREAYREDFAATTNQRATPQRIAVLLWLAVIFIAGWLLSLIVHLILIGRPLGS
jgi:hypothetical protein